MRYWLITFTVNIEQHIRAYYWKDDHYTIHTIATDKGDWSGTFRGAHLSRESITIDSDGVDDDE
jgi:hypothetical protein